MDADSSTQFLTNWYRRLILWFCWCILVGQFGKEASSFRPSQSGCLMVYNDGAKPAIPIPPKCSKNLQRSSRLGCKRVFKEDWDKLIGNCEVAQLQGRRTYQEDRTFCALDVRIPWSGQAEMQEMKVGLLAVFDGHNGAEASELAAKLLPEYFLIHVCFLLEGLYSSDSFVASKKTTEGLPEAGHLSREARQSKPLTENRHCFEDISITEDDITRAEPYGLHCLEMCNRENEDQFSLEVSVKDRCTRNFDLQRSWWISLGISEDSMYRKILKEALLRAIYDVDVAFSNEAFRFDLQSGSGDSKALLCSACSLDKFRGASGREDKRRRLRRRRSRTGQLLGQENSNLGSGNISQSLLCVKELTQDHHPDRDEEKARIEAAGGSVLNWGDVPRVNGELAISRAIGDVSYKKYGVISEPEVTDWQHLSSNDSYLVVASDGIFEKMSTQEVCDLLLEAQRKGNDLTDSLPATMHSLAQVVVSTAFDRGSMDNLAAVVLPLDFTTYSSRSYFKPYFLENYWFGIGIW